MLIYCIKMYNYNHIHNIGFLTTDDYNFFRENIVRSLTPRTYLETGPNLEKTSEAAHAGKARARSSEAARGRLGRAPVRQRGEGSGAPRPRRCGSTGKARVRSYEDYGDDGRG